MDRKAVTGIMLRLLLIGMLTLAFNVQSVKAEPTTWIVDDDGPADFSTIQEAINAASSGDTIYVHNGTYYEHVIINKSNLTLIGEEQSSTIIDGEGTGIVVRIQSDYVTLSHFTIRNSSKADWGYAGIFLYYRRHSTIVENTIELCGSGIIAGYSHANDIRRNKIVNFTYGGIILYYSTFNTIEANYVTSNVTFPAKGQLGIHLDFEANNNIIANNTVVSSQFGIELERSSRNEFINNTVFGNEFGIVFYNWHRFYMGTENRLQLNNLTNNHYSLSISGYYLHHYIQDIDISNIIDGKPILYLVNQHNLVVDPSTFPNLGFLGLINCSNITIRNFNFTRNPSGILLAYTRHSTISNTFVSHNIFGIRLADASNNTIFSNTIAYNNYAIAFHNSSNNVIFHNNFIDGTQLIYDYAWEFSWVSLSINTWDDGYPSGGNYWSDYTGVDEKRGPKQNQHGSDGIGDTSYLIDENNQDNYPLMEPWTLSPREAIQELIETIETWNLPKGTENCFTHKLEGALHLLNIGNKNGAVDKLRGFINQVEALKDKKLTIEQANQLISEAKRIMGLIKE
ncbi:MAG: nitrous oxide reductase family maturation protein NosD [Candidatus Nanoarchaeia archaeon]